jgi:hypothetical protein
MDRYLPEFIEGLQTQVAAADGRFEFPKPSLEIKADWLVLDSCASPPADVHVEQIGKTCYALAGMHLLSKLKKNWIWAMFEPAEQLYQSRPLRGVRLQG